MHIALFTNQRPEEGLEIMLLELLRHLPSDLRLTRYGDHSGSGLQLGEMLMRADRDRMDVVHLAATGTIAIAGLYLAWRLKAPVVGSFEITLTRRTWIEKAYFRSLCHRCERVFAPSKFTRNLMLDAGIAERKILLWSPGVDCGTFAPSRRSAALREKWQVSESRPAVIYTGCLSETSGALRLVSLEAALRRTNPMHRLIVVGDGPDRAELEYRCSQAVFTGAVPQDRMPEMLASADVFVSPGECDAASHALLEAQACGLPCLVMESGSAPERISAQSGIVCRSLVDLIVETASLVRDAARRTEIGRAAREHALHQRWAAGLAPLYAGYRLAAEMSGARRNLRPALVSQRRRL